ncbi:GerMN domain-containing protein [Crocosphaera sp. Alani8]|uniref:GerMN domain-containing protein n=1 Tax=Crocosphaera sp. Alani8 TaxID=3038952 RepID=UPI00313F21F0
MQDKDHQNRSSVGFVAGIIAAMITTGTVTTWWAVHTLTNSTDINNPILKESPFNQSSTTEQSARVYWLEKEGDELQLKETPLTLSKSLTEQQVLETAINKLISETQNLENRTTIPAETKLLSLKLNQQDIHLNLSSEFTTGGGSASMTGRLAQLLYTATSLDPDSQVWVSIEGKPLELLGGEGLMIKQPITRRWFEENFEL